MKGKVCTKCEQWKPLSDFHKEKRCPDGFRPDCKSCRQAYNKQHYANNKEHFKEVRARWYESHRDEHRERVLSKRDPKAHAERTRMWAQTPEGKLKKRENQAVRRTEKGSYRDARGLGRFFKDVLERDGMICHICKGEIPSLDDLHFDHVIPISKGGTHDLDNIRPAHALCNRHKAARTS